eukprot:c26989_g1_i3 orf=280-1212(+)
MASFVVGKCLQGVNWEDEKYPDVQDLAGILLFALFFPAARFFLDRVVLENLGRRFIIGSLKGLGQAEMDKRLKKHVKFKESGWKCVFFLSEELLALAVTWNEPWLTNTQNFWVGPGDQVWPDQKVKLKLRTLYMYAGGFYTYSIFALLFWETRRSDFGVSMSHHVTSLALIILSYLFRFARVGSVVLSLHDGSDVFLEVGKMTKYAGSNIIPSITVILFAISWFLLRLVYYPFWIIWSTSYEVLHAIGKAKHKTEGRIYYYIFNSLLLSLLVLHIYWWILICRMVARQIQERGNLGDDVRSDSEGEDKDD